MARGNIFGKVNVPTTLVKYDGVETETANVVVDNNERTIAVDVKVNEVIKDCATKEELEVGLNTKQDTLVSGINIKTINNESILGSGNIETPFPTNYVTTDSSQLIFGNKTFSDQTDFVGQVNIWGDAHITVIKNGNGNYGLVVSDTTSYTANKTIATIEDIPTNYITTNTDQWDITGGKTFKGSIFFDASGIAQSYHVPTEYNDIVYKGYVDEGVPRLQATSTIVINPLTNINGRVLTAYEATLVGDGSIGTYYHITRQGEILTEELAKNYMEYMTGSRFLPVYNYEKPQNSLFVFADGSFWKPQYANEGFRLYKITNPFALVTQVNAKQDILVSGTNIKTINGNSILGSGDISISLPTNYVTIDTEQTITGNKTIEGNFTVKVGGGNTTNITALSDYTNFGKISTFNSNVNVDGLIFAGGQELRFGGNYLNINDNTDSHNTIMQVNKDYVNTWRPATFLSNVKISAANDTNPPILQTNFDREGGWSVFGRGTTFNGAAEFNGLMWCGGREIRFPDYVDFKDNTEQHNTILKIDQNYINVERILTAKQGINIDVQPTEPQHATRKDYVDTTINTKQDKIVATSADAGKMVAVASDGSLELVAAPSGTKLYQHQITIATTTTLLIVSSRSTPYVSSSTTLLDFCMSMGYTEMKKVVGMYITFTGIEYCMAQLNTSNFTIGYVSSSGVQTYGDSSTVVDSDIVIEL